MIGRYHEPRVDANGNIVFGDPVARPKYGPATRRPHHNDMVLMRDAQELARDQARHGFIRDLILLLAICLPSLMVIIYLAATGLSAAGAFLLIGLGSAGAAGFSWLQWSNACLTVKDAAYRPLAAAYDLIYGRYPPRARLRPLLTMFELLGCIPRGQYRTARHWFVGPLGGADGQLFELAVWQWDEEKLRPMPRFQGLCARFVLARPIKGSLRLRADGNPTEGSDLTLAHRVLTDRVRHALSLLEKRYNGAVTTVIRDGLLFIAVDLKRPWYRLPGLFEPEDEMAHIRATADDIETFWQLAASIDAGWSGT
jgi:hypothetical protein